MKVILRQDVEKIGKLGEVLEVKDGFARNFLIPARLAALATDSNLRQMEEARKRKAHQLEETKKNALELASRLEGLSVTILAQAHEEDRLFGSVSAQDISQALEGEGIKIDKKHISLKEPIKTLGIFTVDVKLHPEVETTVKVWVVKK